MKQLFYKTVGATVALAVFSCFNPSFASDSSQCETEFTSLQKTYSKSNIEATVIISEQNSMEPFSLQHLNRKDITYTTWKTLNNEISGYTLRQGKGFDFNQNRGFVGPLIWHQSLLWDKLFDKVGKLKGYECSILGRTRLAGRKVTVLRLSPVDEIRYGFLVSKDADTALPVELAVYSPNRNFVVKFTVTALHAHAQGDPSFMDETFDRLSRLEESEGSAKTKDSVWRELVIPSNFSHKGSGSETFGEEEVPYQSFTDGIVDFKVYRNSKTTTNIVSATEGSLSVFRKNGPQYEYAVVGEIPLELSSLILSKINP